MAQTERERVPALYRQRLEAWNKRAADDFAAAFTEDGHVVGFDGSLLNGPGGDRVLASRHSRTPCAQAPELLIRFA